METHFCHLLQQLYGNSIAKPWIKGLTFCVLSYFKRSENSGRKGRIAQLVERLPYKQDVGGSSPSSPTTFSHLLPLAAIPTFVVSSHLAEKLWGWIVTQVLIVDDSLISRMFMRKAVGKST